jgi:hypothetical protein
MATGRPPAGQGELEKSLIGSLLSELMSGWAPPYGGRVSGAAPHSATARLPSPLDKQE